MVIRLGKQVTQPPTLFRLTSTVKPPSFRSVLQLTSDDTFLSLLLAALVTLSFMYGGEVSSFEES